MQWALKMEGVSAQVAAPVVIHQKPAPVRHPLTKKRDLPLDSSGSVHENSSGSWNTKCWSWDSTGFIASPLQTEGVKPGKGDHISAALRRKFDLVCDSVKLKQSSNSSQGDHNQYDNLGDGDEPGKSVSNDGLDPIQEPEQVLKPSKRVKMVSSGGSDHPICQVDDCTENLCTAKDYHRRHKVCEVHSKAKNVLVRKQMQRFCQQCSRFHPLLDFDEGKRSCRRRLAGHNKRRRKSQPEDGKVHGRVPGSQPDYIDRGGDIINRLSVLTHGEGTAKRMIKFSRAPGEDQQVQVLRRLNSLPFQVSLPPKRAHQTTMEGIVQDGVISENQNQTPRNDSCPSTRDFMCVLASDPAAHSSSTFGIQSLPSTGKFDLEKSKSICAEQVGFVSIQGSIRELDGPGGGRRNENIALEMSDNLWLHMSRSSPEDTASRNFPSNRIITSCNSSDHSAEKSPASSPPLHDLFPLQASRETCKDGVLSKCEDKILCMQKDQKERTCLQLFGQSVQATEDGSVQSSSCRAATCPSTSGSDQSPYSMNVDVKERSSRIIVKLFGKDPSCLPTSLRTQIYNWLSKSPSDMESYIKPGCVIISFYLSMPSSTWDRLEEKFSDYVNSLVKDIDMDFWGHGRFLVSSGSVMVSLKDGKMHFRKRLRAQVAPELIYVSPLAVVCGQETSLVLRGRSLKTPDIMIHCTHTDGFSVQENSTSALQDNGYDEIHLDGFKISNSTCSSLGRCFIEVDCTSRGFSYFPIIIADQAICHELRFLESELHVEFENKGKLYDRRKRVLHFLDELGWLFQRKSSSCSSEIHENSLCRFKSLLIFCVEHDFCALMRTLLDILLEVTQEVEWETLMEDHLLIRAVKKQSFPMVNLLINYSVVSSSSGSQQLTYIFTPDAPGPGGATPLHLAACTSSSPDLVDALTNDPQEVGLRSWNSILDEKGHSPYAYAVIRNHHSYNALVARKLAERNTDQVSVLIPNKLPSSCSKCTILAAGRYQIKPRPYARSMLAIATVCACVCIILRLHPSLSQKSSPFAWENLDYLSS